MKAFPNLGAYEKAVGTHLGYSDWRTITQEQVDLFADATDDHQWIHTDPERAKSGPFGAPIAHGFLTLSLIPAFLQGIYRVDGLKMIVNYGSNKVRFPRPVPVGSRIRAGAELVGFEHVPHGVQSTVKLTVQVDGSDKPACVAELLSLLRA